MQKKIMIFSLIVVFALVLSACNGTSSTPAVATENEAIAVGTNAIADTSLDNVAAQSLQLAIGVINLRSSQVPIDTAQAETLISLFQNLQTLLGGSYDASQVQSALDAIKAALTAEQIQAISDMGTLTLDNLMMGGKGGQMNGTPDPNMTPDPNITPGVGGRGGGNGQGGPQGPPGAGGPGDGSNPPDTQGAPAEDQNGGPQNMQAMIESIQSSSLQPGLNPDLIGLVISDLQMIK